MNMSLCREFPYGFLGNPVRMGSTTVVSWEWERAWEWLGGHWRELLIRFSHFPPRAS